MKTEKPLNTKPKHKSFACHCCLSCQSYKESQNSLSMHLLRVECIKSCRGGVGGEIVSQAFCVIRFHYLPSSVNVVPIHSERVKNFRIMPFCLFMEKAVSVQHKHRHNFVVLCDEDESNFRLLLFGVGSFPSLGLIFFCAVN